MTEISDTSTQIKSGNKSNDNYVHEKNWQYEVEVFIETRNYERYVDAISFLLRARAPRYLRRICNDKNIKIGTKMYMKNMRK